MVELKTSGEPQNVTNQIKDIEKKNGPKEPGTKTETGELKAVNLPCLLIFLCYFLTSPILFFKSKVK